jgi:hypothetical protein
MEPNHMTRKTPEIVVCSGDQLMRRRAAVLLALFALALGALVTWAQGGAATGDKDVKIPLPRLGDMLVDRAHGHIYITGGPGTNTFVVTDLDGTVVKTLPGNGAAGMALSADGTKLYVAFSDTDGIAVVDTATYAMSWIWTGTNTGDYTCPRDVALVGGQLWFAWGCDSEPYKGLGRVDLATKQFWLNQTDSRITSALMLATAPAQPNTLFAAETDVTSAKVYRFQVTSTWAYTRAVGTTDGGMARHIAVTPDGSQVIVPSGSPYYHQVFRASDMTVVGTYPTTAYPNAVAIRPDGMVAAGSNAPYNTDAFVFEPGGSTPIRTYEFGALPNDVTWAHTLVDGGLAWHENRLYALTHNLSEPDVLTLRIRESSLPLPTLTLNTDRSTYAYNATATLNIHLGTTASNRTVSVYAQSYGAPQKLLQTAAVDASGNLAWRTVVTRMTNFSVRFAGDASYGPTFAARLVKVHARTTNSLSGYYSTSYSWRLYHNEQTPTLTAKVAPSKPGACVYLRIERYVNGAWTYVRTSSCYKLSSTSTLTTQVSLTRTIGMRYRIHAQYRSDPANLAHNAPWVYIRFTD